jgi:hypothetical protein
VIILSIDQDNFDWRASQCFRCFKSAKARAKYYDPGVRLGHVTHQGRMWCVGIHASRLRNIHEAAVSVTTLTMASGQSSGNRVSKVAPSR